MSKDVKETAGQLLRIAKELLAAYRPGTGMIKYAIGDLVRLGTRRNVWEVTNVKLEYAVYDTSRNFITSLAYGSYGKTWKLASGNIPREAGKVKKGYPKVGDTVVLLRNTDRGDAGQEYEIGLVHERYWGKGINTKKRLENAEPEYLEPADAAPRDANGQTAALALVQKYGGKGGMVVISSWHTSWEQVGQIVAAGKAGTIKVQLYGAVSSPRNVHDQETYELDKSQKMELITMKPSLFSGAWKWSRKSDSIVRKYTGRPLTRLLD